MRLPANQPYQITTQYGWVKDYPLHTDPSDPTVPPDQKAKYPGVGYGFHNGVDVVPEDGKIIAPELVTITNYPWNGTDDNGNMIIMTAGNRRMAVCHLESFSKPSGSLQSEGQQLGVMGNTGFADGKHIHFAVTVGGLFVDPLTLIDEGGDVADIFNSGDAKNTSNAILGDVAVPAWISKYVDGKTTYKEAREAIDGSPEFLATQYFNEGDDVNLANSTGWPKEPNVVGWLHKRVITDYITPKVVLEHQAGAPEAQPLKPGIYKVN